jgi:hypothetical protein
MMCYYAKEKLILTIYGVTFYYPTFTGPHIIITIPLNKTNRILCRHNILRCFVTETHITFHTAGSSSHSLRVAASKPTVIWLFKEQNC